MQICTNSKGIQSILMQMLSIRNVFEDFKCKF